jgi:hypothetical protein
MVTSAFNDLFGRDPGGDYWVNYLTGLDSAVNMQDFYDTLLAGATPEDLAYYNDYVLPGGTGGDDGDEPTDITLPESSNPDAEAWMEQLSQVLENYQNAYDQYARLSSDIDDWTQNALNRQRVTGDQVTEVLNSVANQRAGSGIMGGTEATNLDAATMAELADLLAENKSAIELAGNQAKSAAIAGLPETALSGIGQLLNLYSINAADQQNWATLAADLLNSGY